MIDAVQRLTKLASHKYVKYTIYAALILQVAAILYSEVMKGTEAYKAAERFLRTNETMYTTLYPDRTRPQVFAINSIGSENGVPKAHFHIVVRSARGKGTVDIRMEKGNEWRATAALLETGGKAIDLLAAKQ